MINFQVGLFGTITEAGGIGMISVVRTMYEGPDAGPMPIPSERRSDGAVRFTPLITKRGVLEVVCKSRQPWVPSEDLPPFLRARFG